MNEAVPIYGENSDSLRPPLKPFENTIFRPSMTSHSKKGKEKANMAVTVKHPIQTPPIDLSRQIKSACKKNARKSVDLQFEKSSVQGGDNIELEVSKYKEAFARVNWDNGDPVGLIDDTGMDMDVRNPPDPGEDVEVSLVQQTQEEDVETTDVLGGSAHRS